MGDAVEHADSAGATGGDGGPDGIPHRVAGTAPASPDYGMSTPQLAEYVREFAEYCAGRIETSGRDNYDLEDHQAFEDMTVHELVVGLQEELADAAVYAAMVSLLVGRLARQIPEGEWNAQDCLHQ
jgi:hypothetical protein